jgi:multiple sugar transport system substrate-binding protein
VPPHGSADLADIMERVNTEVLFERITPDEAATQLIDEVNAAIAD